jgi:DNA helicase-2/ATP-dependent DNA helicase PcrA
VFVLDAVDGSMPSDLGTGTTAEIEEERRLLYVAMTSAAALLHPRPDAKGARHVYASRTRFIPDRLLGLFGKTTWPLAMAGAASRTASQDRASTWALACAEFGVRRWRSRQSQAWV